MNNMQKIHEALVNCSDVIADFDLEKRSIGPIDVIDEIRGITDNALDTPARMCDKMDKHKAIYDCRILLRKHGYRLTPKQDDIIMKTIYWLYDETIEAENFYCR